VSNARRADVDLSITEGEAPAIEYLAITELGNTGYVITSGEEAVVVDAPRAVECFLEAAERRGTAISHVLDTHVHNDFISGALELSGRTGAVIGAPRRGGYAFPHLPLGEGDEIRFGSARIVAIETPGHTPEHLAYLIHAGDDTEPIAVLTGGSLLVGNAGRSDLLGRDRTDELNRAQFASLRRLTRLADAVRVLPTHGAGSFCVPIGGSSWERTSTVGKERAHNPLLVLDTVEGFLAARAEGLLPIPGYYPHVGPVNRRGPSALAPLRPTGISPAHAAALATDGVLIIDTRERLAFCQEHIPGSINVELDSSLPSRLGSVVPFDAPLVLVLEPEDADTIERATVALARVGFERLLGYVAGGIDAWRGERRPLAMLPTATPEDLWDALRSDDPPLVVDVRMPVEWEEGLGVEEALLIHLGDLPDRIDELPRDREIWTLCSAGMRATIAATLLRRAGLRARPVATGGVLDLLLIRAEEAERTPSPQEGGGASLPITRR